MDRKDLKKLLAGLGVAGLISTGGIVTPNVQGASGWSATKASAGSAEKGVEQATDEAKKVEEAVTEKAKEAAAESDKKMEEAAEAVKEKVEKPAGSSGWSGSK